MRKKTIVIAGNHREFGNFLNIIEPERRDDYVEADFAQKIMGIEASKVITIGTWYERKDSWDIKELADSRIR